MTHDEYEHLDTEHFAIHLLAGAVAGFMEFCIMFPIDTVKTRMQSIKFKGKESVYEYLVKMIKREGTLSPLRGISVIAIAAGPAHGLYFANYELMKKFLTTAGHSRSYDSIGHGIAGAYATFFHDLIMNPSEVVKQRMQMKESICKGALKCTVDIYKSEGVRAFYRSFLTTLMMNIPFQSIHFMVYEICQNMANKDRTYHPVSHLVSGGIAGGIASAVTNPLDVCKTLLNTQEHNETIETVREAASTIYRKRGILGFLGGIRARIVYTVPSTAICWSTYEFFKVALMARKKQE